MLVELQLLNVLSGWCDSNFPWISLRIVILDPINVKLVYSELLQPTVDSKNIQIS